MERRVTASEDQSRLPSPTAAASCGSRSVALGPGLADLADSTLPCCWLLPGFRALEMKFVGLCLLISERSVPSGKAIFKSNGR